MRSRGLGLGIVFALAVGSPARAQVVRGTLTEEGSRIPLEGAVVALVSGDDESTRARGLSDASGAFHLAGTPGRWRVRAELIGHRTVYSEPFELGSGDEVVVDLSTPVEAVSLGQLDVTAANRQCTVRPDEKGLLTALAWEQARKALESSFLSQESELTRFGAVLYERDLDPRTLSVEDERLEPYRAAGARPFSGASPESLATQGFVQATDSGTFYYAPDERVLLSDVFLDGHCFNVRSSDDQPDLLGLAFEPVQGTRQTDVDGVLWLDRDTGELRSLDYRYVNLRLGVPTDSLGGGMRFQRLPTGVWIPRRWWIRMPVIEIRQRRILGRIREERVLAGILERGGEVLSVDAGGVRLEWPDGRETPRSRPAPLPEETLVVQDTVRTARLTGRITDRTTGQLLPRVVVRVRGTALETLSGPRGEFELAEVPAGRQVLELEHPIYGRRSQEIEIDAGAVISLTVSLEADAVELDPLTVTVEARRTPGEARFHARRERGVGFFMVEEQIARLQPVQMNDLFNAVPGLTVACGQPDVLGSGCRVQFERARALDLGGRERPCPVQYFLDGSPVSKETVDALRPVNVLGIEVYNGLSEIPPELRRGPDARCGTIAVWLKARR